MNFLSPRKNFYLFILSQPDKTEIMRCLSVIVFVFNCVRFANVCSVTTALSSESQPAIWRGSDCDRKGCDPTFRKTSACYSAKVSAASAARPQARACVRELSHLCCPN